MARKSEIMITDSFGNTAFIDMSDVKTKKLNRWQGWYCGTGIENINILNRGRVFGAVCKNGVELGNIYKTFKLATKPTICEKPSCHCGSDILIPKTKKLQNFNKLHKNKINSQKADLSSIETIDGNFKLREKNTIAVDWNIGKRCNFNCSYCPDSVHDKNSPHIPMHDFMTAINNLESQIPSDKNLKITFTGGEPTFNPNFFAFVSFLKNHFKERVTIFTNTNGSHTNEYLNNLNKFSTLLISVHFEFIDVARFIKKIRYLVEQRQNEQRYDLNTLLYVKIMVTPKTIEKAKDLFFDLTHFRQHAFDLRVNLEPIVDKEDDYKLINYTEEQKKLIRDLNEHDRLLRTNLESFFKFFTNNKLIKSKEKIERRFANL